MKYKTFDGKEFNERRQARRYLRSIGKGKNMKDHYTNIPEFSNDFTARKY